MIAVKKLGPPPVQVLKKLEYQLRGTRRPIGMTASEVVLTAIRGQVRAFAQRRTGRLENSFAVKFETNETGVVARITSDVPYARIHETGGTIRPRTAGALTIPLTGKARSMRARNMPGLFHPKGRSFLATRGGKGGGITPQYALVRSVTLPARRYLTKALAIARPHLTRAFYQAITKATKNAIGGR